VNSYQYKKKQIISGMCRQKAQKKTIYNKKQTQAQIYRFINIAKEIVNRSRIKLSGFIELAIAIRHFS
jgi:hypothetical protein